MRTNIFSLLKNQKSVVLALWTAVVLLLAVPQGMLAETKTVTYKPSSYITWAEWQTYSGNNAYVTLTGDGDPQVTSEGRLRITESQEKARKVTFTSKANTYIASYSYSAYQPTTGGTYAKCYAYFKENDDASSSNNTFTITDAKTVNRPENGFVDYTSSKTNALSISLYNSPGTVWDWGLKTVNTYGAINNVVLNLLIPEVKTSSNGQTALKVISWVDKTWAKNTGKSIEIVYDVKDALAPGDFAVSYSKTAGNGTFSATITSFDPLTQKLTVTVKYKTADRDDYAENFSGTVTVSSVNTVNTATYTTTINGTAGAVLSDNNLRFDIDATQFVNTHYTTAVHTYTNSDATVTYSSSEESVAYFADEDQTLHIVGVGSAKLTATQSATTEIKSGSAELTITVTKRTANFVYTPSGNLYTSHKYPGFVTVDNDPNNSLPQLTYESDMKDKFMVDADGTARTYAVTATPTLTITADNAIEKSTNGIRWQDEWNAINVSHPVTIVKDPTTVEFCMSEAYVELGNTEFCNVTGTGDAFWANNNLKIGSDESSSQVPTTVVLAFKGIPNQLTFEFNRPNHGIKDNLLSQGDFGYTLNIYESADGISWSAAKYTKTKSNNNNTTDISGSGTVKLASTTRYLKIEYTGCVYVYFSSFCVTAATDMTVDPTSLALETTASGTTGEFTISHSNMDSITITSSNTAFTVNQSTFSFENGLGIGAFGEIDVTVSYDGSKPVAASDSLTITGKKVGGGEITQKVALSVIHPTHYVRAVATVQAGQGKVFVNTDGSTPASGDYVTPSKSVDTNCEAAGSDSIDFYYYAQPDAGWNFAGWRETPAAMSYIDQPNDAYLKQTFAALSKNSGSPTTYNRYAIFFKGYPSAPVFRLENLNLADTKSGQSVSGTLVVEGDPSGRPKYIVANEISIEFEDIAGHAGEAAKFSAGTYNKGTHSFPITFDPSPNQHLTDRTYQAKAVVTATNDEFDENGDFLQKRTTTHECLVTVVCHPADMVSFSVPGEIDFGYVETVTQLGSALVLSNVENMVGEPTLTLSNTVFTKVLYDEISHTFALGYEFHAGQEGQLTATATVTAYNYDGVPVTSDPIKLKVVANKPQFTVNDLSMGSMVSGDEPIHAYLPLGNPHGIDPTQVTINITDAPGHSGESSVFSSLAYDAVAQSFYITFAPVGAHVDVKNYQAQATISATNIVGTTSITVLLNATVLPSAPATYTVADSHAFGSLQRNQSETWQAVLSNIENAGEELPTINFDGPNASYFSASAYDPVNHRFTVKFTPLAVNPSCSATAHVIVKNYDGKPTEKTITLTGACVPAPAASFDVQNSDNESVVGTGVYFGDFNVGDAATRTLYIANLLNIKEGTVPAISIAPDGKFAAAAYNATTKSFDVTFTALPGMETVQNAVATFTVLNNDDQVTEKTVPLSAFVVQTPDFDVRVTDSEGNLIEGGETSWAEGLALANKAANAGCTVTLMRAVTGLTAYQEIKNTFTLDLNGKKLSGKNNGSIIYINSEGKTLTIKDSKSDGRIENINNTFTGVAYGVNVTAGGLILHSGTIHVENAGASRRRAVGILSKANTNVTINGGKVEVYGYNDSYGIYQESNKDNNTTFTMNAGEIAIEGYSSIMGILAYGKVNVNGGTINATATYRYSYGIRMYASSNATPANCYWGTLNMTGGTINSNCTRDENTTREAYGVFFDCANTGMGTATATDKSHANKAAAVGSITNATINVSTNSRYAYGVIAYGSYQSKTNTYDKIKINNSTINATAKYYYAYGVYATGSVDATHGAIYFANIELTDCDVNAVVEINSTAYGVWATTGSNTVYANEHPNYAGEYAGGATVTINSGTYTATTGTTTAFAVGTSARARTTYDPETSVYANKKLGGNAEAVAKLNIHGGTFRATAGTTTARAVSNGGDCTIDGGEFYATTGTSTVDGIYTVSGKLKATGVKINVTAGTNTAYGVRVDVSDIPINEQAWTGFTYHGDAELNNLDVTVTTSTSTTAYGVFATAKALLYTTANFEARKTSAGWSANNYAQWKAVSRLDQSFADYARVVVNGGTYTVNAATTTAYGAFSNTTSVAADKSKAVAAEMTLKNATFNVTTNGTTYAYGVYSNGTTTVDGCKLIVQPKTTTAYGVYVYDGTTTVTNTTIDVKGTTTVHGFYANAAINSTHGYDYHGNLDLGEGNNVTVAATAGNTAHVMTLIASKRNIASGDFAGDYANAATAIVRDGSYKATATGTTTYVLNLSANQVQGAVSAAPSCTIEGGKFWATASGGTQGVCTSNGVAGNILIKGGVYNINTYLGTFLAPGYDEVPIESGRAEYTEGYRYEVLPAGPHGTYVCQIGTGTKYKTLEEALTAVKSGEVIHMLANYTLPAGDYILPTGATLMVPYKDGTGKGASTAIGNSAETTTSATTPVLFRKLTFASGARLTCQGSNTILETCAEQKADGQYGACVGMPSGAYGQIHLEEGAHIELESGSRLNCWGYITGKGTINVKNGATSLEGFQLGDWCGGSNASSLNNNSDKVFPITHYFYQSIECPITYRPGAKAIGSTHVYVSRTVAGQDAIGLVGTSGSMFLMTPEDASKDTWVMKDYDETTDQCIWTINNGASVGNLSISMSAGFISYNFQSANYDLPITTNMTIVMNYGEMGISQNAVLLPGAQWIVNKEGTANIDGVSLVAYDVDDWTGTKRYFASYSPTWGTNNPRKNIALQDAEVFVHGKVNIKSNGGLYTTAGGANVHSTNEDAGEVIYTTAAQGNKTTKYLQQGGTTRVSLTAYPAMLKNGVGIDPAFSESAGTVAGKTWIYYDNQWQCWTQDEYCIYRDNEGHPYAKPDGYVALNEQEADVDYASLIHDAATGTHAYIWDADCYWWEVNPTPVEEGIYRSINEDHNGKLNCYEFNKNGWCWEIKNVTVTWNGEGVTTTNYTNVGYGTSPKWFGATPVKSGYVWDGWQINGAGTVYSNDDLPLVTANTTFTSHFKQNPVLYNITFKNPDGTVLDSRNWESGSTPSYEGTPTQNPTAGENYTWNGTWSPTITTVTAATEYTAQYNSTTRQYDVTFLDYNNEELETKKVNYNVAPTYTGGPSTPTREDPTDTYIYEFSGWKNQQTGTTGLAAVKGDQTYVAQYTHHKKWFNIRFVDYNGTTLQTGPVLRNTMPTPANPTRESDAQYDYSFKAWSPTIVAATENATYTATYNMTLRSYTVRFLNYDGTVLQTETLDYGTTPSYKGDTPTYADESKEFIGWDDVMRSVNCNKDYTAQYTTKTYTITVTSAGNGSVAGGGVYSHGSVATLTATPEEGFAFDHWNDDNTDNPRSLTVTATATYTATFVSDETGDYLDIVDWTNSTVTINANGWTASGWPYTVNGTPYAKNSRNADRTLTIPYSGDAGTNLTISVASGSVISKRKYSIPFINTIDGTTETSVVYVNSGKLTIDGSKTLAAVYVAPGAELEITGSLTVGKLFLRTDNAQSAILTNTGTLTATNVYYTRITRSNATYDQFGLPLDCALSSVTMSNAGKLGSSEMPYGSAWNLKSYNEASRAEYGKQDDGSNWTLLAADATIKGGTGYQMMSTSKYFREYYFPVDLSQLGNSVPVSYTEGAAGPDHRGWNIICSPLTSVYKVISADPATGIKLNWLEPAGDAYVQEPADTILPARPFAFQTTESCTKLVFNNDHSLVYQAPRRVAAVDNTETEWLHLDIKDANNRGDQTSLYVHPSRFDEVYEAGVDVAKLSFSASHALLYSTHAYGEMAFAGVADELLEQGVALTVYSPKAQELTISMRENEWLHRMTFVWLIDKATGAQIDLLESDYSFSAEAGTTAGRFFLMGAFFAPQITTDNGTVQGDEDIKAKKFIYKDKMYIQINGLIYDATGKLVKLIRY